MVRSHITNFGRFEYPFAVTWLSWLVYRSFLQCIAVESLPCISSFPISRAKIRQTFPHLPDSQSNYAQRTTPITISPPIFRKTPVFSRHPIVSLANFYIFTPTFMFIGVSTTQTGMTTDTCSALSKQGVFLTHVHVMLENIAEGGGEDGEEEGEQMIGPEDEEALKTPSSSPFLLTIFRTLRLLINFRGSPSNACEVLRPFLPDFNPS